MFQICARILVFSLLFAMSHISYAQSLNTTDSIRTFYDSLFFHLQKDYLFTDRVDWDTLKPWISFQALESTNLEASLQHCSTLFDKIGGNHCQVFSETGWYASTLNKGLQREEFSDNLLIKYQEHMKNPAVEVQVLENKFGYLLLPGMLLLNVSQDSLDRKSQEIYDAILGLHQSHDIEGWIIDLRFNIGGNSYPMLAALYHLIGDNIVYTLLNGAQEVAVPHTLADGAFFSGQKKETEVRSRQRPQTELPVAIIVGKMTASAGENVVLGFRGRKNVVIIGEETYGFLTGNDLVELPFGIKMAMTTGYLADRSGTYTPTIIPQIEVIKEDNFKELLKDRNILEAIQFIDSK